MPKYFIKDIENITGVKAHTIRVWEQRYHLLTPKRTETNLRYYTQGDIKFLLNVVFLYNHGVKISCIAGMSPDDIKGEVLRISDLPCEKSAILHSMTLATYELDEAEFTRLLSNQIIQEGFEGAFLKVIFPFLRKIGKLWLADSMHPGHEHFVSNIVKNKLLLAIEGQRRKSENGMNFLLFLPEQEYHELGLLFAQYILRSRGHQVYYLGGNTPLQDLEKVFRQKQIDVLFTTIISPTLETCAVGISKKLKPIWNQSEIWMGGDFNENIQEGLKELNVTHLNCPEVFIAKVDGLSKHQLN